jgi:hypothetical protein
MYAPGCSQGAAQIGGLEAFILRKVSQGNPQAIAAIELIQGREGGPSTVSVAPPEPAGIGSKDRRFDST